MSIPSRGCAMEDHLFRGAMTKAKLISLPEDCWILSGVCHNDGTPILTARVGDVKSRAELWALMRTRDVVGRNFTVLRDEAALNAELKHREQIRAKSEERKDERMYV